MTAWPCVRLGECTTVVSGGTPATSDPAFWGGDICWATPKDLSELSGAFISDTPRKITEIGLKNCAATVLPVGSVLFSSRAPIGHVAINTTPMATNQGFKSFVPDPKRVEAKYLYHWLRWNRPNLERLGNGATFKEVSTATVSRVEIPLPSLPNQRRIAAILDKADDLRAKRRAALARLDMLTQAIFVEMFGDPAANPRGWPRRRLGEVFAIARGGSPRPIDDFFTDDPDGVNWILIGDATAGSKYISSTRKRIRPEGARRSRIVVSGDFLLSNSMSYGRPYIMRTTGCIHDGWLVLSPRDTAFDADYFYALLRSDAAYTEFSRRAPGATVKNLNIELVRDVALPVGPAELQCKFSERIRALESRQARMRDCLAALDNLFASLQQRAFYGEL